MNWLASILTLFRFFSIVGRDGSVGGSTPTTPPPNMVDGGSGLDPWG